MTVPVIFKVAIAAPLRRFFDYLPADDDQSPVIGARVRVPFGRRHTVGVVCAVTDRSDLPAGRLKKITELLDPEPLMMGPVIDLLLWASSYYLHPVGEVVLGALPPPLRQGRGATPQTERFWRLTSAGRAIEAGKLDRAPVQKRLWQVLTEAPDHGLPMSALRLLSVRAPSALARMQTHGWVESEARTVTEQSDVPRAFSPPLTEAQSNAVQEIASALGGFASFLLHGVTGSGKTEVYLHAIEQALARGAQALVLVPEIALTPQLVARFRARLTAPVVVLHSARSDSERTNAWLAARAGRAAVIIGTRSAVFTPLQKPGLIIVDEEHDTSYKQQDGFRYHARDVAVMRASREGVPIVLGSATPSLESLRNARDGNYRLLVLPDRTGGAGMPDVELLDLRRLPLADSLSHPLRTAVAERLSRGEQSLLFLNRRGFAPAWMCHACGWVATCSRCDARLTYHYGRRRLICHHCGHEAPLIEICPQCSAPGPRALGEGTERIEQSIGRLFPAARRVRVDRDATRVRGALEESLRRISAGEADILIGTQMLSKGHDFPNVTLVGIVNADQGLYSADFRSEERLMQQILQVAGRAGRADKPGRVLIQTWHPEHPLFRALSRHDFNGFADYLLAERSDAGYPPFSFLALLRSESPKAGEALAFLKHAAQLARPAEGVVLMDPVPSPMERRQGRYRAQLLVQAPRRKALHSFLGRWVDDIAASKQAHRVRWSLDVDPIDLY